jgi:hypothetical protein
MGIDSCTRAQALADLKKKNLYCIKNWIGVEFKKKKTLVLLILLNKDVQLVFIRNSNKPF